MPRKKLQLQPPAVTALALFTQVTVIGANRSPLSQLFHLIRFIKQARVLVFRRNQADKFWLGLYLPGFSRTLRAINAEMRVDMRLAILCPPPCSPRGREGHGHPDLTEIPSAPAQGRW